jgi:hypothetical protein
MSRKGSPSIEWTYGEKLHILKKVVAAQAQGQSITSVARDLCVSKQTIYGFLRNRKEIEETVTSSKGGSAVKRSRKNDNLRTLNLLVFNEMSGFPSSTSTIHLINATKEAGARMRMKLLKEQVVASNELARLENFKASRPWAQKLVVKLQNSGKMKCTKKLAGKLQNSGKMKCTKKLVGKLQNSGKMKCTKKLVVKLQNSGKMKCTKVQCNNITSGLSTGNCIKNHSTLERTGCYQGRASKTGKLQSK